MGLISLLIRLIGELAGTSGGTAKALIQLQVLYERMNDSQLRAELARHLATGRQRAHRSPLLARLLERFRDSPALHALAIAVCLFNRHPCDLPPGSRLYDEQVDAALLLISGTNVQMDTGEGKTYAVGVAAVALLAEHAQTIVITANAYLAERDLQRMRPFYTACAVACVRGTPSPDFRGVAYVTLGELCFAYLQRAYRTPTAPGPEYPAAAAIVIDEIDSVLLDQTLDHRTSRFLPSDGATWDAVFGLIRDWDDRKYTYNPVSDSVSLTADAWAEVVAHSRLTGWPVALLMNMVAAAVWAQRAVEGRNYVVEDGAIHLINRITGETFDTADATQRALEYLVLQRKPALSLGVAAIDGLTLLRRHPLVVGLSGTAQEDTLYYLQQLGTLTAVVPPRFERHRADVVTLISAGRDETLRYVAEQIRAVAPRPVVIGAWSPGEARAVADWLLANGVVDAGRLAVITTFDSSTDVAALRVAGQPDRVTVLSQGGSRGVDVRSTHRPLLLVLGRAVEPRLDRQFLGRVGRHGELFDAQFIVDSDSPIWFNQLLFARRMYGRIMPVDGTSSRLMRANQRAAWLQRVRRRQQLSVLSQAIGRIELAQAEHFRRLRELSSQSQVKGLVAEMFAELSQRPVGGGTPDGDAVAEPVDLTMTDVLGALERREATDALVRDFEEAVSAIHGDTFLRYTGRYAVETVTPGDPAELVALTHWMRHGLARHGGAGSGDAAAELFRQHTAMAASQHLPAPTTPHRRSPVEIMYETRLMANATMHTQIEHRLEALWVSSSREEYYRRSVFAVRNVFDLSELTVRLSTLNHLMQADRPHNLDDLFYSHDHAISIGAKPTREPPPPDTPAAIAAPTPAHLTQEDAERLVAEYLQERDQTPGGLALPADYARLLLLDVLRPFQSGPASVGALALRQHVKLMIDALAAKGTSGSVLRLHRRLIADFTDEMHRKGVLPVKLAHTPPIVSALRRVRAFLATVPPLGVLAVLAYAGVFALGTLVPGAPVRRIAGVDLATNMFGFGVVAQARPVLVLFAAAAVATIVARAAGLADAHVLLTRLAPVLAIATAFVCYGTGLSGLGSTVLLAVFLAVWLGFLMLSQAFVRTFVGVDANAILAAVSAACFLVDAAVRGEATVIALMAVGVVAAIAGPRIPILVASEEFARGRLRYSDHRSKIRVHPDPLLTSALVAFVIVVIAVGVSGPVALGGFLLFQSVMLVVLTHRHLGQDRIRDMLAKLRVGSPFSDDGLQRFLRRTAIWTSAAAVVLLAAAVLPAAWQRATTVNLLLTQWAGVWLVLGIRAATGVFSVSSRTTPRWADADEPGKRTALRERLRAWRQTRFKAVWRTALLIVLLARPLTWLAEWLDVVDVAVDIWKWIVSLL
ncbi:MAG: hypothetical protein HOV79_19205 [Hamadaea sp.]|nr:hypothetical protein [Hamadaea sp.]